MTAAQQLLTEITNRKQHNLAFFQRYFPKVYEEFKNRVFKQLKLNIDPATLAIELLDANGKGLYEGDVFAFAKKEAQLFSNTYAPGKANFPMRPSYVGEFHQGRFFHSRLENFLKQVNSTAENTSAYLFEQSLGQVVFLGVGTGLHLQELFKLRLVKHAVLVEHDSDNFLASLYLTDWQALLMPFIESDDRSFTFSVGDSTALSEDKRLHEAFANAWNAMCMNVPFMP